MEGGDLIARMALRCLRSDPALAAFGGAPMDRAEKGNVADRHGDDPPLRVVRRGDGAGGIHQRHDPAAEDVPCRVGIGGHRQGPDGKLAARLRGQNRASRLV
jgi:hypothetical protein